MTWDVRTNIKAKPGSQGTLFQGGSGQMTDAKWPRRYTPERLHEVRDVVAAGQSSVFRGKPSLGEDDAAGETRRLVDNIARSTVPGEHLQELQFGANVHPDDMEHGEGDARMTADGLYTPSKMFKGRGYIKVGRGMADNPVAIHEIGHHVDHMTGVRPVQTRTDLGHSEGRADAYADTHFRDRRGRPTTTFDGYRYVEPDSVRNDEFFAAYHGTRPRQPSFPPHPPETPLPGLDGATVYKLGRKKSQS